MSTTGPSAFNGVSPSRNPYEIDVAAGVLSAVAVQGFWDDRLPMDDQQHATAPNGIGSE